MYEEFFGLSLKPFELVPNPQFLYPSLSHQKAINYLQYGIRKRMGFILFTGEVGSGKTTILRNLIRTANPDTIISMVFNTRIDGQQLIAMINEDFGLEPGGKDMRGLLRELNDFLIDQHAQGRHPIIIVDEAQNLSTEALEEVRLLSNLETDSLKLVQIILVGQPELRNLINQPALRQLRQRINLHCHLESLSREETEAYVYHRLEVAGNRDALVFTKGIFDLIFTFSGGTPRLINLFCDFILLAAFVDGTKQLSVEMVNEVMDDIAWKEETAEQPQPEVMGGKKNNAAAMQIMRKLALIENELGRVRGDIDELRQLKQKLHSLDMLVQHIDLQQLQIRRVEELLGRFENIIRTARSEFQSRGQLVDMKDVNKAKEKSGFLTRLFG